ncbi:hypothetical protein ACF1AO_34595 [Streptomyces longwoodensis]|uniref:hypothetical protein n=1 Tax=Streptomyces longwoodensis TaxID=68231 RepID=UPI0036FCDBF1
MRKYLKAGDSVLVLDGPEKGQTLTVSSVRMFAADNGYLLNGGRGLYPPKAVELVAERPDGNPCGAACDPGKHDALSTCDHCRGTCTCALHRATEK